MAIDHVTDIRCEHALAHVASTTPPPRAVAVVNTELWGRRNWFPRCHGCLDTLQAADDHYRVAYLFTVGQPAADHPGHVHVRYADGVSAEHPTNI